MNKTLMAAIAGVLVGGVAIAAYQQGGFGGEYADVLKVEPITTTEKVYAQVESADPITETVSGPREVCEDVQVQERLPEKDGNVGGTVVGAVVGGLLGNQVGGGSGKKLATVGGAVAGGAIGHKIDKDHERGQVVTRTERQCHTVTDTSEQVVGYDVAYRTEDGETGTMRTKKKPGSRVSLGEAERTIGYDVTYRYKDQVNTVRMDEEPGDRLPVEDGAVVTASAGGGTKG